MKTSAVLGLTAATAVTVTTTVVLHQHLSQGEGEQTIHNTPKEQIHTLSQNHKEKGTSGNDTIETSDKAIPNGTTVKSLFDTKPVNRRGQHQPLLNIRKGSCFENFFPNVDLQRPTNTTDINNSVDATTQLTHSNIIPSGFTLSGSTHPVGCKLMKFSEAKEGAGFGYMSETTVRNGQYGLALYAAVTNTKQKTTTDLEYWLLFLEKKGDSWTLNKSYYWSLALSLTKVGSGDLHQFSFGAWTPDNQAWKWAPKSTQPATFNKLFDGAQHAESELWDENDKLYAGVWTYDANGADSGKSHLFYDGANERWSLNRWLSPNASPAKDQPIPFMNQIKLTQKGKWQSMTDYCSGLSGKDVSSLTTQALGKCLKEQILSSAGN